MKQTEWNEGLNHIDLDLVQEYVEQKEKLTNKRNRKSLWHRASALAACLALILGAVFVGPWMLEDEPNIPPLPDSEQTVPEVPPNSEQPELNLPPDSDQFKPITNPQIPSSAPLYHGSEYANGTSGGSADLDIAGLSVTAQWLETLPDTYTFFDDWRQEEWRLVRMKTTELLKGQEMTDEFYYLIPVDFMTDFSLFDCFLIKDMAQFTYDHSVLYNKTQGKTEQMSLVIFGYCTYRYQYLGENFMAFDADGHFDGRIWSATEAWIEWTNHTQAEDVASLDEVKESIRSETWNTRLYVHLLKDITNEAADALSQIKSFENGLYVPNSSSTTLFLGPEVQFHARRYINGFATNEMISIWGEQDTDQVTFTKARFNEQDMASLPDLTSAFYSIIGALENGNISPPNIQATITLKNTTSSVFAWYAKTENGVIGIVRVSWCLYTQDYKTHFDDAYFIVKYGSQDCHQISRDDLLELLGEYETAYIYSGNYYEYGKDIRYRVRY